MRSRKLNVMVALSVTAVVASAGVLVPVAPRAELHSSMRQAGAQVTSARAAFIKYMSAYAPFIRSGTAEVHGANSTLVASENWSGFADVESGSQTFSGVSGNWVIPSVSCPNGLYRNTDVLLAQWVGLDGWTDNTVEQLGTAAQCFEGATYYWVWYEMFPGRMVVEGTQACITNNVDCPKPGDQISASVTVTPGARGVNNYALSLTDSTEPINDFSVSQPCATRTCFDSSAEWILERPAFGNYFGPQIVPLADYSTAGFTNGRQVSGGASGDIASFSGGPVYDMPMTDDLGSYYLDCIGQSGSPGKLLLTADASACPVVSPSSGGSFTATWDGSF